MEKKTMGSFLAALRKAEGMTQRELAEQLGVSDKTISRWERDDGQPDLSVIPVLAEIFGVTCDELLRGQRSSPQQRKTSTPPPPEKTEKQRQHLLIITQARFYNRSWIAAAIAGAGLLAAAVAALGFRQTMAGFFFGCIFYLAAFLCEAIWSSSALLAVSEDMVSEEQYQQFCRQLRRWSEAVYLFTAILLGATVPLLYLDDAYWALSDGSLLLHVLLCGSIGGLVAAVILYCHHGSAYRRGTLALSEQEEERFLHNRRWKNRCGVVLSLLLLLTGLLHITITGAGPSFFVQGTTFTDYDSFVAYMEQDIPYPGLPSDPNPQKETLKLSDGTVACEYWDRNATVTSISYMSSEDTLLPITVATYDDLEEAEDRLAACHRIFLAVYCIEAAGAVLFYWLKRKKA